MSIVIGYQGQEGSFSESAAKKMAEKCGLNDVVYKPLVSAAPVIDALKEGKIDYALVATRNSIGGNVRETMSVVKNMHLRLKRADFFPIHQCLFKLSEEIDNKDITQIVSHVQALYQTKKYCEAQFHGVKVVEADDTALAAKELREGVLNEHTAVICSKEAGNLHGLCMIAENIEDDSNNKTEFRLFCMPEKNSIESRALDDDFAKGGVISDLLIKGIVFLCLLIILWYVNHINGSPWAIAGSLSGYIVTVYFLLKKGKEYIESRALVGFWKYYSFPDNKVDESQEYHIPRVVEIRHSGGQYDLTIISPNSTDPGLKVKAKQAFLYSDKAYKGKFIYEYGSARRSKIDVDGYAILDWYKRYAWSKIKKMDGNYFGIRSKEIGSFTYYRISKEEFDDICLSRFLSAEDITTYIP